MIRQWLSTAGQVMLPGPLLALLALALVLLFGLACYGWGHRAALAELDEQRAEVRAAIARETTARIDARVPGQRGGGR